jgi:hypothetical protein
VGHAARDRKVLQGTVRQVNGYDEWIALAGNCFAGLAAQAGLKPKAYRMTQRWVKQDARRFHVVLLMQAPDTPGAPALIHKQVFRPEDPAEFNGILDAQQRAWDCLAAHPRATVPEILAQDRAMKACVMRFVPGQTLRALCGSQADHRAFLRAAGVWLSAYHRGTFVQDRQFQPRFMARHMLHLAGQMQAGTRRVPHQARFVALAHRVQDVARASEGRMSKVAAKHGDMNDHNILIDGDRVAGYDFLPASDAPVGYDIARLLLSHLVSSGDLDRIPKGHVLPPETLEAFFEGYDLVPPDDPGVTFLLRVQILTDWNRLADKNDSARTAIAAGRLRAIAEKAFG